MGEAARPFFVIIGPAGSGKSTVVERLVQDFKLVRAKTSTTRKPRPGETASDYNFLCEDEFFEQDLLEYDQYDENYYGITKDGVDQADIAVMTLKGAVAVQRHCGQCGRECHILYFKCSNDAVSDRLTARGDDPGSIARRLMEKWELEAEATINPEFKPATVVCCDLPAGEVYEIVKEFIQRRLE